MLIASFDLPREVRSRELSGITWDDRARILYAISDELPSIVPMFPSPKYDAWTFGDAIPLEVSSPWDGEGLALTETGFAVANEAGPHLYDLDRSGHVRAEVPLPDHFASAVPNAALESLSVSPDRRYLFTANERALRDDGGQPTTLRGTTIRILRMDRVSGARVEFAYRTDAVFAEGDGGEIGVADVAALADADLLVLERAYVPHVGNQIRIYRVNLSGAADVLELPSLNADTPVVPKVLLIDLADVPGQDRRHGAPGAHPLYANYEGLALGPRRDDGRRMLFLVSDDNNKPDQIPRLLTLALDVP